MPGFAVMGLSWRRFWAISHAEGSDVSGLQGRL